MGINRFFCFIAVAKITIFQVDIWHDFQYSCSEATRLAHTKRILCTDICLFISLFILEEACDTE